MMWTCRFLDSTSHERKRIGDLVDAAAEELDAAMTPRTRAERLLEENIRRKS
jgi:hypothetical protein